MRARTSLDEALDILDQMARALESAHAQGIVHRDLKPSNTFLVRLPREQRPIVKLLDFGLVKLAVADGVEKTASGAVIGTALYISPEQARGPNVDGRTDIYALGCIAYELVLGCHPFPDVRTPTAAIAAHLLEPPPLPRTIWPAIPSELDRLLFSMLAKEPSARPSLEQVRAVISGVQRARQFPTPPALPRPVTQATHARSASVTTEVPVESPRWRGGLVAFIGLTGISGFIIAAVVASGGSAPSGLAPRNVNDRPAHAIEETTPIEIDASVAAVPVPDASMIEQISPAALKSEPPVETGTVTPSPAVDRVVPASPSIDKKIDRRARKVEPKAAHESERETAAEPSSTDEDEADRASSEADEPITATTKPAETKPTPTAPPSVRRMPPTPTAKPPPNRDVIVNPYNKKKGDRL